MKLNIRLKKSLIGCKKDQIATAHSLGLKKIGDFTVQENIPQTMGKINKIIHLISVEEVK